MELFENEEIKQIEGYPNYFITSFGRVWSDYGTGRWLKPTINKRGNHARAYVSLGRGNKFYVHQLVAKAFIENPYNLDEVDHIDTNGLNNKVENLRWVTHQQNLLNENTQENVKKNSGLCKEVIDLTTGIVYNSLQEAEEKTGIKKATISTHIRGMVKNPRWQATGNRSLPKDS